MGSQSGFPGLQPAYIIKVNVGQGNPVGDVYTGSSFVHYNTPTGSITTVDGFEPKIEADVVFGGDWLYFDPDKERARINVKAVAKMYADECIHVYSELLMERGIAKVNDEIRKIFAGHPDARTIPFGQSTTIHTFEVGNPEYSDLQNSSWAGNGRFVLADGKLTVESRVSKVVPSTDMD
ncbi:hypothetical protein BGW36DRAFT_353159 [Talaromyces proteolyticus]|uniref:Uncharacterized protein n=1 Tax=Talaromyces proteolyticus TaxID=1131652 RepID=A0AAD4Q344_9EURO|nr:uncharacterized protein BGW36DRAFT_353159 [Talaromyces proteolyticus]KAH8704709.1 hypothetical protein BGW36DRAFT_353159 [Talaromyces proteolyticus]